MHDNRETPGVVMVSKREFVGLTDEEIEKVWNGIGYSKPWSEYRIVVSRAIEAKLKEKNSAT
jgi:hypothetical protein